MDGQDMGDLSPAGYGRNNLGSRPNVRNDYPGFLWYRSLRALSAEPLSHLIHQPTSNMSCSIQSTIKCQDPLLIPNQSVRLGRVRPMTH